MEENQNEDSLLFASYFECEKMLFSQNSFEIHEALLKLEQMIKGTNNNVLINKIFLQIAHLFTSALNHIRYRILEVFSFSKIYKSNFFLKNLVLYTKQKICCNGFE